MVQTRPEYQNRQNEIGPCLVPLDYMMANVVWRVRGSTCAFRATIHIMMHSTAGRRRTKSKDFVANLITCIVRQDLGPWSHWLITAVVSSLFMWQHTL